MSNKKNWIWMGVISFVLVGVIVALCVGITSAWFIARRSAQGNLEFREGIKVEYSNLYLDQQDASTKTLKLAYIKNNTLYPLDVSGVDGSETFNIANPSVKALEGTVPYYLRVQLDIKLYFKNSEGQEVLIDNSTRDEFLAKTEVYTKNGEPYVVTNEKKLFISLPELDVSNLVYYNNWYYFADTQGEINQFNDIALTEFSYEDEETETIKFLKENLNGDVPLVLDNSIDFAETMPFSKMIIELNIEAVETVAVSVWNS